MDELRRSKEWLGTFFLLVQFVTPYIFFGENHTFDIVPQAQNIKRYNLYATKWKKKYAIETPFMRHIHNTKYFGLIIDRTCNVIKMSLQWSMAEALIAYHYLIKMAKTFSFLPLAQQKPSLGITGRRYIHSYWTTKYLQ